MAVLTLAAAAVALAGAQADLPVGDARCGEITCPQYYYCTDFDKHCNSCMRVCDRQSNNYEQQTCEERCQDFIHDERYVNAAVIKNLSWKVQHLTIVASVALVIAILLLVVLATLIVRKLCIQKHLLWRFTKRSASHATGKKQVGDDPEAGNKAAAVATALQLPVAGSTDDSPSPPAPLSRSVSRDVATPATTSTPLSRPRHPSEDTTLDYAYDNPALAPSPSPGKEQPLSDTTLDANSSPVPTTIGFGGRKESSF